MGLGLLFFFFFFRGRAGKKAWLLLAKGHPPAKPAAAAGASLHASCLPAAAPQPPASRLEALPRQGSGKGLGLDAAPAAPTAPGRTRRRLLSLGMCGSP